MAPKTSANSGGDSGAFSAMPAESPADAGLLAQMGSLWAEYQDLSHDCFRLAALETRRAGQSLVTMLIAAVMLGLLLSAAWLGSLAAGVQWLIEHELRASSAIWLAVACNLVLALSLFGIIRRRARFLQFPATQRSLKPLADRPADRDLR
ncbi:phage holin family protein [Methylococcaceae bacterium WWC4]|nr:phage holin family protein [Methylococcaceae bacterium WWC4]